MAKLSGKTKKSLSSKMPLRQINREPEKANSQENADDAIGKAIAIASAKKPDKKFLPVSKEIFDRIGYGFGSQQFVSILFFLTGASFFVIGAINGARVVLSTLVSLLLQQYAKIKSVRRIVSASGIIFGFSFLLISTAVFLHSVALFSLAVLLGGASIVPYSDLYQKLVREKDKTYLRRIVNYGLIITAISLFVSAFLMDFFPITGVPVEFSIFGKLFSFRVYGYLIAFEATALSFILSGYILSFIDVKDESEGSSAFKSFRESWSQLRQKMPYFLGNRAILILVIAGALTSLSQTIGNSYYGIFVYDHFINKGFGGFLNVAVVFLIAVFSSIFGSLVSKIDSKAYGKFPTLAFGTLLMAVMPLSYYYKPNLILVAMGTMSGIIGAAIVGVANGLLALELVSESERGFYFSFYSFFVIIAYLVFAPMLSYFAQIFGLSSLFLLLALILVMVTLLYVIAVALQSQPA